jgi:hypothetical protein
MTNQAVTGLIEAALAIAEERRALLSKLRLALESGNETQIFGLARQLCGLEDEQEGN